MYFLSPDYILSEYRWDIATGWAGGNGCADCIDRAGFQVPGYAYGEEQCALCDHWHDPSTDVRRVGFLSPGVPGSLGRWLRRYRLIVGGPGCWLRCLLESSKRAGFCVV